jgi:activator of 2-hydroxyglutaryl-CoA dehydratase
MLNQGVPREDIALSAFHAIVKQTVGGLAQGLELKPPIIFEGGPLTYDHTLVRAFAERLNLKDEDIIRPEHPETIVARGAAIAVDELFPEAAGSAEGAASPDGILIEDAVHALDGGVVRVDHEGGKIKKPYFENEEECRVWREEHKLPELAKIEVKRGDTLNVYIGVDAGSTTSKIVLMTEDEKVFDRFYAIWGEYHGILSYTAGDDNASLLTGRYGRKYGRHEFVGHAVAQEREFIQVKEVGGETTYTVRRRGCNDDTGVVRKLDRELVP